MKRIGNFEEIVLAVVKLLGMNAYGASIWAEIYDQTGKECSIGAIYTTLRRMEKKGFVKSRIGEATKVRGGKAKKYYQIEGLGEKALQQAHFERLSLGFEGGV